MNGEGTDCSQIDPVPPFSEHANSIPLAKLISRESTDSERERRKLGEAGGSRASLNGGTGKKEIDLMRFHA